MQRADPFERFLSTFLEVASIVGCFSVVGISAYSFYHAFAYGGLPPAPVQIGYWVTFTMWLGGVYAHKWLFGEAA